MELVQLYPRWVTGVVCSPAVAVQTLCPQQMLTVLKLSLLHRAQLSDLFGADYPAQSARIQVTWVVWNYLGARRYLVQTAVARSLTTATYLWPSANWIERELWEMFGVVATGHPDLRRLLTDYGFVGYPLRKDFPTGGYTEVRYSERSKRVVLRPVFFTQEFRVFDFLSPWQK